MYFPNNTRARLGCIRGKFNELVIYSLCKLCLQIRTLKRIQIKCFTHTVRFLPFAAEQKTNRANSVTSIVHKKERDRVTRVFRCSAVKAIVTRK